MTELKCISHELRINISIDNIKNLERLFFLDFIEHKQKGFFFNILQFNSLLAPPFELVQGMVNETIGELST